MKLRESMKELREAMKEVWESDREWVTKQNVLQWLTMICCSAVVLWPWVPIGYFFMFSPLAPLGRFPWLFYLGICGGAVWSLYWARVFGRWWPF